MRHIAKYLDVDLVLRIGDPGSWYAAPGNRSSLVYRHKKRQGITCLL